MPRKRSPCAAVERWPGGCRGCARNPSAAPGYCKRPASPAGFFASGAARNLAKNRGKSGNPRCDSADNGSASGSGGIGQSAPRRPHTRPPGAWKPALCARNLLSSSTRRGTRKSRPLRSVAPLPHFGGGIIPPISPSFLSILRSQSHPNITRFYDGSVEKHS